MRSSLLPFLPHAVSFDEVSGDEADAFTAARSRNRVGLTVEELEREERADAARAASRAADLKARLRAEVVAKR